MGIQEYVYDGLYKVPLYWKKLTGVEIVDNIIMNYDKVPTKCTEYVSEYQIPWISEHGIHEQRESNGSIYVILTDFNKDNKVTIDQLKEYVKNYTNTKFYKMMEANGMVDNKIIDSLKSKKI